MKQKTADYKRYQNDVRDMVIWLDGDKFEWPFGSEQVFVCVHAGLSNKAADLDNIIKPLLDTYQVMYDDFNDKNVYGISMFKDLVPRGSEYLDVSIIRKNNDTNDNT
tara:strand:- start:4899 stop:5219 length:321 start_codon:yes stop_codon:yes gene_type:complete